MARQRLYVTFVSQRREQVFQSVKFDFVHRCKQHADSALGKTFLMEPYQVCFGKVADGCVLIFAKGHLGGYQPLHGFFGCH